MKETKEINYQQDKGKRTNPYKGLNFYQESDKDVFYGRDEEISNLSRLAANNRLTVVMGESGVGKTSLLNAGLFPRLRDANYFPIRVRLNYSPEARSLVDQVHNVINNELQNRGIEIKSQVNGRSTTHLTADETLWEYFRRVNHFEQPSDKRKSDSNMITPVLVFDQFEEFFTLGKQEDEKEKNELIDELYYLIEDQYPASLEKRMQESKQDAKRIKEILFSNTRLDVRVIISLREDYLPHLVDLKSRIPYIDRTLFRVTHLNGKQARSIIDMPGGIQDEKVAGQILEMFAPGDEDKGKPIQDERLVVEPSILSIICFQVFAEGSRSLVPGDRNRILSVFYDSVIKEFPGKVQEFIEDRMLNEDGRRVHVPLTPGMPLEKPLLQLVDLRILRKFSMEGNDYLEIIHDVLTPLIKARRDERQRKKESRKFAVWIGIILLILLAIVSIIFTISYRGQYKNAQVNRLTAEALLESPIDNIRAIRIAEAAYKMGLPRPPARTIQALGNIGFSFQKKPFYTLAIHQNGTIYSAIFSPRGDSILTASEDETARVWDLKGNIVKELKGHTGRLMTAVFSPSGRYILTGSWDKSARLWNPDGTLIKEFKHNSIVEVVAFSHEGGRFLTASRDGAVKVWDIQGNLLSYQINHDDSISSAIFSPNDKMILTASWDKNVKLWSDSEKKPIIFAHNDAVSSAIFSPDGRLVLTASWDKSARLWHLDGSMKQELNHDDAVTSAVFSKDGSRVLTASRDGICRVWDLENSRLPLMLRHGSPLLSVAFSPDELKIVSLSEEGSARVWDSQGRLLASLGDKEKWIKCAAFSQDSRRLLTGSTDGDIQVWDFELKEPILVNLQEHNADIKIAKFFPNDNRILYAATDGSIKLIDLLNKVTVDLKRHNIPISSVSFSRDGCRILTFAVDGSIKVHDLKKYEIKSDLKREDSRILSAELSPNGNQILEVSDGTVGLWACEGKDVKFIRRLVNKAPVSSAIFSPTGDRILASLADNTLILWDKNARILANLAGHKGLISSMKFSSDGSRILTAYRDSSALLWTTTGKVTAVFNHNAPVSSAIFSKDDSRILTAGQDNSARVWNNKGKLLLDLQHDSPIACAAFSPDNRLIIVGCKDGKTLLYDMKGHLLLSLKHDGAVSSVAFSNDGSRVLSISSSGAAKLWLTPDAIYSWLKKAGIPELSRKDKEKLGID